MPQAASAPLAEKPSAVPGPSMRGRLARASGRALRLALWSCFALAVFAVALAALAPASALGRAIPLTAQIEAMSGRIWQGTARIAGGHSLDWSVQGMGLQLVLTGSDTQLTGRAEIWPLQRRIALVEVSGIAGAGLLSLAQGLEGSSCNLAASFEGVGLSYGRSGASAEGRIDLPEGTCARRGMTARVPAMRITLGSKGDAAALEAVTPQEVLLGAARLSPERLTLRLEPEGAAQVPGLPSGGPIVVERELRPPRWLP